MRIPNVVCCPGRTDATIVAAIKAVVEKCNGHWDGIGVYDVTQAANQVDSNGIAVISNITKQASAENLIAVWPSVKGIDGAEVAGSTVVAALYGRNDAVQVGNVPVRTIGTSTCSHGHHKSAANTQIRVGGGGGTGSILSHHQ